MFGSALLYYLLLKPLSLLPYPILYGISNFFYYVIFYIVGYRKKVVFKNLKNSFPEKSDEELMVIMKKFYRHFCDLVVESVKNFSISDAAARKRFKSIHSEVMNDYAAKGQSVILAGGHYANWEFWAVAGPQHLDHNVVAIYKKLRNDYFDQKMRESRGKFGLQLVRTLDTGEFFKSNVENNIAMVFGFDQSPSNPKKCVWVDFLGQETGALYGAEKYAKDYNLPIIYGEQRKVKRGYYEIEYELLTDNPNAFANGEITQLLHTRLEKDIRKAPEFWLWSHKRWKHKRPQ
ncbi:MAG: lysophospholipid acyltransferase family protein [Flavobacteriales bacterium]